MSKSLPTSRGKPVALIQRIGEEDLEDYIVYSSPKIRREIEGRWQRYLKDGKTVPTSELAEGRGKAGGRVERRSSQLPTLRPLRMKS